MGFLVSEVPRWPRENHCFSCHNNGDAVRALYAARQFGYPVPAASLQDTTDWLMTPLHWKENKGDKEFSDQQLADLQFSSALRAAIETGAVANKRIAVAALGRAAALVSEHQSQDGSWQIDASGAIGSPATYGQYLATVAAVRVLRSANDEGKKSALDRGTRWLRAQRPVTVLDAAATLSGLDPKENGPTLALQQHCLQVIRRGEDPEGGWGPYVTSRSEPFDTAVVLLALTNLHQRPDLQPMIARGRRYLVESQHQDGSWTETTRPANGVSYAQQLSTCGWATLGLLATVQFGEERD